MTGFASTGALIYDVEKIKIEISWLTTGQFEDFGKVFDEKFIANLLEKIGKYIFSNYFNSQAPVSPELASRGVFRLSRLSLNS